MPCHPKIGGKVETKTVWTWSIRKQNEHEHRNREHEARLSDAIRASEEGVPEIRRPLGLLLFGDTWLSIIMIETIVQPNPQFFAETGEL